MRRSLSPSPPLRLPSTTDHREGEFGSRESVFPSLVLVPGTTKPPGVYSAQPLPRPQYYASSLHLEFRASCGHVHPTLPICISSYTSTSSYRTEPGHSAVRCRPFTRASFPIAVVQHCAFHALLSRLSRRPTDSPGPLWATLSQLQQPSVCHVQFHSVSRAPGRFCAPAFAPVFRWSPRRPGDRFSDYPVTPHIADTTRARLHPLAGQQDFNTGVPHLSASTLATPQISPNYGLTSAYGSFDLDLHHILMLASLRS